MRLREGFRVAGSHRTLLLRHYPDILLQDDTVMACQPLAPIETGEVFLKGKDPFGGIRDLTGENKTADTVIFKISGTQALVKDGVLAMKNRHGRNSIMLFGLPELKFITSTGPIGDGPDEFKYPALVPAQSDTSLLCYVYDAVGETFYTLSNDGFSKVILSILGNRP